MIREPMSEGTIEQITEKKPFHIKTAKEFIKSKSFQEWNEVYKDDDEYLEYIEGHPETLVENNLVRIDNTVWPREIVEGTTEKGKVVRELIYLNDKIDRISRWTRLTFKKHVPVDIINALDFCEDDTLEFKEKVITEAYKELEEYDKMIKKIEKRVNEIGINLLKRYIKVIRKLDMIDNYSEFTLVNVYLEHVPELGSTFNLDTLPKILNFLKNENITEELVKHLEEIIEKKAVTEKRRKEKNNRADMIRYLTEPGNKRRRKYMKIAANFMEDVSVIQELSSLGNLSTEQLEKLTTLTKSVEQLYDRLENVSSYVTRFINRNKQMIEDEYGINIDLTDFPHTKQELEIFVKVNEFVNKLAREYGLYSVDELEAQVDEEIWRDDIFSQMEVS
jgi:hypothetical protein